MTAAALATLIRKYTGTNSTTYSDASMLADVNVCKDEIAESVHQYAPNLLMVPAVFDLVADQREYQLPTDILTNVLKVEVKFSSSDSRIALKPLAQYDDSETEAEIVNNFANTEGNCSYVMRRKSIYILSGTITAVTAGVRIWYSIFPADLTDMTLNATDLSVNPTTTSFGIPKQLHELLARRVSIMWKGYQGKPVALSETEKRYDKDLSEKIVGLSAMDLGLEVTGYVPEGADVWADGSDL